VPDQFVFSTRDDATSSSLLLRVKMQEPAAWERLVHLYSPLVYNWCRRAGLQEADARDVGQEIFQAVWSQIQTFKKDQPGHSFRCWLRTVTQHKICDWYRRTRSQPAAQGGAEDVTRTVPDPARALSESDAEQDRVEARSLCHRAIALIRTEFADTTWRAFAAVVMHDQKPADVAQALEISVNQVYLAKSRVLRRLRVEFEDLLEL
jgi:RNA polymerase sigma-70 factor (ECF subfamily)